jgi:hypothetical protein
MEHQLFHIFRNTPSGRESFLQSLYFCSRVDVQPVVYIPDHTKFLLYFDNDVVQVDLDSSYLTEPESAKTHCDALMGEFGLQGAYHAPKYYTASTLPDIKPDFDFMCCPRSVSDLSSKIGLGYIGPRVRRIVRSARFPVLLPSVVFKPWKSVAVFFGGSVNAAKAFRLGERISRLAEVPMDVFTHLEGEDRGYYEELIETKGLASPFSDAVRRWEVFENGRLEENLYNVPHDALLVLGAFGHSLLRELLFGSKIERVQSTLPNSMLIVGPNYVARF